VKVFWKTISLLRDKGVFISWRKGCPEVSEPIQRLQKSDLPDKKVRNLQVKPVGVAFEKD
jgi:hypothetical protein